MAERGPYAKVAQNLCVDKSTVSRTLKSFHTNGSVSNRPYPKERAFRKLGTPAQLPIFEQTRNLPV